MKKTLLSVAVAAALGVTSFSSMAALLSDGSAAAVYASEINRESTGSELVPNPAIDFPVGYGIKTGNPNSLIARIDFTGAVIGATPLSPATTMPGYASDGVTTVVTGSVSQGGLTGDSYVVFGLTATADMSPTDMFTLTNLQALKIAAGATNVGMTYRLYTSALDASAGNDNFLASTSSTGQLFGFKNGITTTATPATSTPVALVTDDFKTVNNSAAGAGTVGTLVNVGSINVSHDGVGGSGVLQAGILGPITAVSNIIASTNLEIQGDFSAIDPATTVAGFTNLFLTDDPTCVAGTKTHANTVVDQTATFTLSSGYLAAPAGVDLSLCIQGDGAKSFAKSSYTANLVNVVAQTNYSATAVDAVFGAVGEVKRDGTTLHASFATTLGQPSRFIFVNTGNVPAPITSYTLHMNDGVTATTVLDVTTTPMVIPPSANGLGGRLPMKSTQIVSAFSVGTAYAISFNIAAPSNTVFGTYQLLMPGSTVQTVVPLIAVGSGVQ